MHLNKRLLVLLYFYYPLYTVRTTGGSRFQFLGTAKITANTTVFFLSQHSLSIICDHSERMQCAVVNVLLENFGSCNPC